VSIIAGMETHQAEVLRETTTKNALGETVRSQPGSVVVAAMSLLLEHLSAGRAQREWGLQTDAEYRATFDAGYNVQVGDVLRPTYGPFAVGERLRVLDLRHAPQLDAWVAALKVTND
jgi:hypothetical protein